MPRERSWLPLAAVLLALAAGALLRGWDLGRPDLSFDEAFTLSVSRLPVGKIPSALRELDAHPPLDYVLRHPVATGSTSAARLRAPSVVLSMAAAAAAALWLRKRGWIGVGVTVLVAIAPFQVEFGRDARMYAAMALLGVLAAWTATRWLEEPRARHAVVAGLLTLLAMWCHSSGLFLGAGLLAVAGTRRDRDAWTWRACLAVAASAWAVTWGPAFLEQFDRTHSGWIPYTTPAGVARTVNELVDSYPALAWLGLAAVVGGGAALVRWADPVLRRVWVCCFAFPLLLVALVGVRSHVLLPRTLAFAAWGPLMALVFIVEAARRRWVVLGAAAAVMVAVLLVPSLVAAPWRDPEDHEAAFAYAEAHAHDGDVVAVHPAWLGPLAEWRIGVHQGGRHQPVVLPARLYATGIAEGAAPQGGRVWLVEPVDYSANAAGFRSCGPAVTRGSYRVRCLDATSAIVASGTGMPVP